jgi:hypothetical protein
VKAFDPALADLQFAKFSQIMSDAEAKGLLKKHKKK